MLEETRVNGKQRLRNTSNMQFYAVFHFLFLWTTFPREEEKLRWPANCPKAFSARGKHLEVTEVDAARA